MEIKKRNIFICDFNFGFNRFEDFNQRFSKYISEHKRLSSYIDSDFIKIYIYNMFTAIDVVVSIDGSGIYKASIWNSCYLNSTNQNFDEFMGDMLFIIYDEIIKRNRCGKLTNKGGRLL